MSGSRAGRHERFFSKLIAVLSVSAALLVVALVLQSRLTARRNAQVAQQQTLNPSETVAPLIVRAATPEPDPNATQTPVATPAPAAERVEYDFLPIYTGIETDERVIAITLEDMTDVAQFQAAVQIAMSFDAKLTLFPYGKAVQDNNMGAMLKYCVESLNYEIENRTWNDGLLYKMSDSDMANEIFLGDNMIDRAMGMNYEMRFFRMHGGYGTNDVRTHAYLHALGYQGVVNAGRGGLLERPPAQYARARQYLPVPYHGGGQCKASESARLCAGARVSVCDREHAARAGRECVCACGCAVARSGGARAGIDAEHLY